MDRVVVVTGSARGIGRATALAFAARGDTVVATVRDPTTAEGLRAAADDAGLHIEVTGLDVSDDAAAVEVVERVIGQHGRIDVLVNNAGAPFNATLEELTMDELRRSLDVNFLGVARTTKAALPFMRKAGRGHVIAVTSLGGTVGQPFTDAYCAAKFAVEGLYESLQPVAATFGIHVSIVEPGPVETGFDDKVVLPDPAVSAPFAVLRSRHAAVMASGDGRRQSPEDAGAFIAGVADEAHPVLRYQTGGLVRRIASMKLADLTGEGVTAFTASWLAEPARG
jgi:NAD(P)-dependent dehydrogenase (short-subunit alcohol dehydrogenase family)